ncbi:MAG TPA: TRAP transporter small permease subunit [Xanthobacteraceae bacterium]|jgi:TRAP-type mannitol/chloroaromatic compound transport system permease small subunit|nr:TRAP transporter small permease subunit [Xanthobacteraceae bacterium]
MLVYGMGPFQRLLQIIDSTAARAVWLAQWLALPIVALLFLQWPLRDLFKSFSREANDLGQVLFAVYITVAVTAATRAGTHLAADVIAKRYGRKTRRLLFRLGIAFGALPWALLILTAGAGIVIPSASGLERFPDTFNPGYFIIKLALWILAVLMLMQAALNLIRPDVKDSE